jgi:hypothetical protein
MVSTFLFGTASGNRSNELDFMRRDDVRTIFSVYRIWQEEGQTRPVACRHEVADAMRVIERRMKPLPRGPVENSHLSLIPHPGA